MSDAVRVPLYPPDGGNTPSPASTRFRLVDIGHCLEFACISESTFYRLVKQGLMPPPVKIGRANRFVESEVIAAYQRLAHGEDC